MTREDLAKLFRGIGVEVGVLEGGFSDTILRAGRTRLHYMVDAWDASTSNDPSYSNIDWRAAYEKAVQVAQRHSWEGKPVAILRLPSVMASCLFPQNSLDYVYIDANHDYKSVRCDIDVWFPLVRPGGIISGHDYLNKPPVYEVKRAVDESFGDLVLTTDEAEWPSWYLRKPKDYEI